MRRAPGEAVRKMPGMKRQMPPLNRLRALEAAIRHESFTKAAEELNVTQGAISRHIRDLEDSLGFPLFERVNNNLLVPPESREFGAALTRAFDGINRASHALLQTKRRTVLTVRGYTNFMMRWLIPRLPAFQALEPRIEMRVSAGREETDFELDDVDLAFRFGMGQWPGLHADMLFPAEVMLVCTPELARRLDLKQPEDVLRGTVYHSYSRREEWPRWFKLVSDKPFVPEAEVFLEDPVVADQCVLSGMGLGLTHRHFVQGDLAAGRLISPFDTVMRGPFAYYLICPPERLDIPKNASFRKWVLEVARGEAE